MKNIFLSIILSLVFVNATGLNVKIVESQSYNVGHVMDTVWLNLMTSLGHTATIEPQSLLSNNSFFASTDVLIISSGVITLPANYVTTIEQFLQAGKPVYLQAEYLTSYTSTQAFATLVNSLGGTFVWGNTMSGDLQPTFPQASFATTPNTVPSINYFWYGVEAPTTPTVSSVLTYQGNNLGFFFCPPVACTGKLITTTDQDWIRSADAADLQLMENIFHHLTDSTSLCSGTTSQNLFLGNDTLLCNGDTLLLSVNGNYTSYLWQNGTTNSTLLVSVPGTYYVTATSPCDSKTDTIVITYNACGAAPIVAFAASDTLWCDKTCIDYYDLSQNNPTSWLWYFSGASPATSTIQNPTGICYNNYGSFDVSLVACNAAGCDSVYSNSFVTEFQLPPPPVVTQFNDTLYSTPAPYYAWYNVLNPNLILGTNNYFVPTQAGNYYVLISDSNGCEVPSNVIGVALALYETSTVAAQINYDHTQLVIALKNVKHGSVYKLCDVSGRMILKGNVQTPATNIDCSMLQAGVYTITVYDSRALVAQRVMIY